MWRSLSKRAKLSAMVLAMFLSQLQAAVVHSVPSSELPVRVWMPDPVQWTQWSGIQEVCELWAEVCMYEPLYLRPLYQSPLAAELNAPRGAAETCQPWVVRGQWTLWQMTCPAPAAEFSGGLTHDGPDNPPFDPPDNPVPEPGHGLAVGASLVALFLWRRRLTQRRGDRH